MSGVSTPRPTHSRLHHAERPNRRGCSTDRPFGEIRAQLDGIADTYWSVNSRLRERSRTSNIRDSLRGYQRSSTLPRALTERARVRRFSMEETRPCCSSPTLRQALAQVLHGDAEPLVQVASDDLVRARCVRARPRRRTLAPPTTYEGTGPPRAIASSGAASAPAPPT